ncbi:DUF4410 domain-containing protein [Uliginosibacterium paludis]|uniref:DUF4410 domain-containing protein n=1 Tax=Uliginosibacterium paludis TaxID=1615952 RepID=A0ABV2CN48_9RHOO
MSNKRLFAAIFVLASLVSGCATHMPNNVEGDAGLGRTRPIIVENFDFNPKGAVDVSADSIEKLNLELSENVVSELKKMGLPAKLADKSAPAQDAYVLKGRILQVNGGSTALRIWIGFGAGSTTVTVRGEVLDAKTGAQVRNFTLTRQSNWTYSNNEAAVRENIGELASDIAALFKPAD